MLTVSYLSFLFEDRQRFENVNIKFTKGNCYGLIGPNGSGKSTILKVISGEQDNPCGKISLYPDKRLSLLKQDHHIFDNYTVLYQVIQGNQTLYKIKK